LFKKRYPVRDVPDLAGYVDLANKKQRKGLFKKVVFRDSVYLSSTR